MKKLIIYSCMGILVALSGCSNEKKVNQTNHSEVEKTSQSSVTKSQVISGKNQSDVTFAEQRDDYDVVSGATQTTFGSNPKAKYSKEEKLAKMFWSNQPPLGYLEGYYYHNEGQFEGGNYGIVEVVTNQETNDILNVEFTEFASDPYYEEKYSGVNKRLSDYAFFQAANPRTDDTLVTVVNGITFVEQQMREENRVTGEFETVKGSSNSARKGFMPLAAQMDQWIREPYNAMYYGYAEELDNGLIGRLQIVTTDGKITDVRYDEYFADIPEKMTDEALKPFYRQSKYYSLDYNQETNHDFVKFADALKKDVINNQELFSSNEKLKEHPSYPIYESLAKQLKGLGK
ncbi:hypothetical protein CBF34_03820 [Vagococcus penaei]|uniref:hypothetical protein n=1 Tax=Vagococcus penaei TaxID=633807 RepID=UPI000F87B36C|nr:hypothetical protein [Vagococcus penaei]RSU05318.1 hypothetical protein CBF34_03820 [Vagococcus penaei]